MGEIPEEMELFDIDEMASPNNEELEPGDENFERENENFEEDNEKLTAVHYGRPRRPRRYGSRSVDACYRVPRFTPHYYFTGNVFPRNRRMTCGEPRTYCLSRPCSVFPSPSCYPDCYPPTMSGCSYMDAYMGMPMYQYMNGLQGWGGYYGGCGMVY
ncbi:uncharacterized protein LOC119648334 [Hermetia illucens]|uniref:uncharacterized protein LOC119648334 n=1 Tax=Hermetia illucens TaxID=343691 RepID=UPI0018CC5BA6|nr:uncharacterized protein LOC119648334 [Hermetia illucens]